MRIAVDSSRQAMVATGNVSAEMEWEDTPDGRRKSKTVQARDEATGMPLWSVEVLVATVNFGETSTDSVKVLAGGVEKPEPQPFTPITFKFLDVDTRLDRKTNSIAYRWVASEVDNLTPAQPANQQSVASKSSSKSAA